MALGPRRLPCLPVHLSACLLTCLPAHLPTRLWLWAFADCRAYLTTEIVPHVREGLLKLVKAVERQRIQLAAGAQWDSDGYLPHRWAPFSPLRYAWHAHMHARASSAPDPALVLHGEERVCARAHTVMRRCVAHD